MNDITATTTTEETTNVPAQQPDNASATPSPDGSDAPAGDTVTGGEGDDADAPFPKKAVNKIHREERKNHKLKAMNRDLKQRLAAYEAGKSKQTASPTKEPQEADFESYGDYLKARQDHQFSSHKQEQTDTGQKADLDQRKQAIRTEQANLFVAERNDFVKNVKDAAQVFRQAGPAINAFPQEIVDLVFELDNPVTALYTLAKEGRLDSVGSMSRELAAAELVAAQLRGGQTLNSVPANSSGDTQEIDTPRPMAGARGTGTSTSKSLDTMDAGQLVRHFRKK